MITIAGKKLELEDKVVRRGHTFPKQIRPFETTATITPQNYVLTLKGDFPDYSANSAISMKQGFNGNKHLDTIVETLKSGLAVPRARDFIQHLLNINAQEPVAYNANGVLLECQKLNNYTQTLNHNCWVWLNDSFELSKSSDAFLGLDLVTITGLDKSGKPVYQREPLQPCLSEDCYAELNSANSQGFLTKKAEVQEYQPGKTVYSICPQADRAVRFDAYPDFAFLNCYWNPLSSNPRLGVFPLASVKGASLEKIE